MSDGRPVGQGGTGLYDSAVVPPGRPRAYDDPRRTRHNGRFAARAVLLPPRTALPAPSAHGSGHEDLAASVRETAAPVWIRCFRHEGVVLGNRQRTRDLAWLAGTWELALADGRTLTGPASLPALRPGETAAVPLPFALPRDGGEAWLTLRVTTAEDRPGVPRGSEVCALRLRLFAAEPEPEPRPDAGPWRPVPRRGALRAGGDGPLAPPLPRASAVRALLRASARHGEPDGSVTRRAAVRLGSLVRRLVPADRDGARVAAVAEYAGTAELGHRRSARAGRRGLLRATALLGAARRARPPRP
ncbi:DUF4981 domain-containing protein [Streptomyces sp. NPDC059378]|uniref:DUF4981 domain-containing protein n=1 Tax=Streptomyces sp. NPDC059378 TaxID=3346815 RepID=UPI0036A51D3D